MKKTVITVIVSLLAGYVLAPQVAKIPLISKLPQI